MLTALFRSPWIDTRRHALRCAVLGALMVAGCLAWWPGGPTAALLLGVFVLVPLGLALAAPPPQPSWQRRLWQAAVWLQLPAALVLLAATLLERGSLAALLALPWLLVTFLVALSGLARLFRRGLRPLSELA